MANTLGHPRNFLAGFAIKHLLPPGVVNQNPVGGPVLDHSMFNAGLMPPGTFPSHMVAKPSSAPEEVTSLDNASAVGEADTDCPVVPREIPATTSHSVLSVTGPTGPMGPPGLMGSGLSASSTGPTGPNGLDGQDGLAGSTGATGDTGAAGQDGVNGLDGATGATGAAGQDGATGAAGQDGASGATGPAGAAGQMGPTGASASSISSETGPTGSTGATGPRGEVTQQLVLTTVTGPTGPAGSMISDLAVVKGSWEPVLTTLSGSVSLIKSSGSYVKMGNNVNCRFTITVNRAQGKTSESLLISNLPFESNTDTGLVSLNFWTRLKNNPIQVSGIVSHQKQSAEIFCITTKTTKFNPLTVGDLDTNSELIGSISYLSNI